MGACPEFKWLKCSCAGMAVCKTSGKHFHYEVNDKQLTTCEISVKGLFVLLLLTNVLISISHPVKGYVSTIFIYTLKFYSIKWL